MLSRRRVVGALSLAGTGALVPSFAAAPAEDRLETTSVRLVQDPSTCVAPEYVVDDLLRDEGFTEIGYAEVATDADDQKMLNENKADFALDFALKFVMAIDAGDPLTVLCGVHLGCFELFARDSIRNIRDLKGRSIGGDAIGASGPAFLASLGAAIGFDAMRDVRWVMESTPSPIQRFIDGELDAFLAHPPEVQQLRARRVGHVLVSSYSDRPWSQYFCCVLGARSDYVRKHPVATKRVVRALLRAADICSSDPARAARRLVDRKITDDYEAALDTVRDIRFHRWRDYDPEDAMRFYALRLHEAGMIKSTPAKIIAKGTDWRFFNEARRELKT
jgi:NitT/TauT family transport system substrate-binding protein